MLLTQLLLLLLLLLLSLLLLLVHRAKLGVEKSGRPALKKLGAVLLLQLPQLVLVERL